MVLIQIPRGFSLGQREPKVVHGDFNDLQDVIIINKNSLVSFLYYF